MKKTIEVGNRVKTMREDKKLSVEDVEERKGLSVVQIKEIEDHNILHPLATLIKSARALSVRLGTFLDDQDGMGPVVCRKGENMEPSLSFTSDNLDNKKHMAYHSLSGSKSGRHMEPFFINIAPKKDIDFILSSHEGEEFILVLEGGIEINYGENVYTLNTGDTIYYDSIVPHLVRGTDESGAKIVAVIYTPI